MRARRCPSPRPTATAPSWGCNPGASRSRRGDRPARRWQPAYPVAPREGRWNSLRCRHRSRRRRTGHPYGEPVYPWNCVWPRSPTRHARDGRAYDADAAMDDTSELKHSPLEKEHVSLGAKLGPFGGWLMPIEYAGAISEHRAVRERVGIFDLTHLGKVEVAGPGALGLLQGVVTNDVSAVEIGQAQYNLVLNEGGGVI